MSPVLIECVPNFSCGRDAAVIEAIAQSIRSVSGVSLLDVDPGEATNRTVMTFVGAPEPVLAAAFAAIRCARDRIDMRRHHGEHSRIGATDVVPFVPVAGASMADCERLAHRLGERVGEELGIPVYFYERAARQPERRNLAAVRAGEWEGLRARLQDANWQPDAGPSEWSDAVAASGATVIGARPFLIAWNIDLNTRSKRLAMKIAAELRTRGKLKRDAAGTIQRDAAGKALRVPGRFAELKGVGWFIDEYDRAQLSFNLTDFQVTNLHQVFDAAVEEAARLGLRVTGSELVGLVPKEALIAAGCHYLERQGSSRGIAERDVIATAVQSLGLSELAPFDPTQRVIEYRIAAQRPLISLSAADFVERTAAAVPAPGGGSVAALAGALGAGLSAMVANLTIGRKNPGRHREELEDLAVEAHELKATMLAAVDDDTNAFDSILAARRLPRADATQRSDRDAAIQAATRRAIEVPLLVLGSAARAVELAEQAAEQGMASSRSDAGVAGLAAAAAAEGAFLNVAINLGDLDDIEARREIARDARELLTVARAAAARVQSQMEELSAALAGALEGEARP